MFVIELPTSLRTVLGGVSGLGGASATGLARLGCVDKELIGIFVVSFVFVVVWRLFG